MSNLKVLLFVFALCWGAAALWVAGSVLARVTFARTLGRVVRWVAFVVYVLGLIGTGGVVWSVMDREGGGSLASTFVALVIIPIGACTVFFYKAVRAWRRARSQPSVAQTSEPP